MARRRGDRGARWVRPTWYGVEVWQDVPLDPGTTGSGHLRMRVKFVVAIFGDEGEADQRAAEAVIFGVQKVPHMAALLALRLRCSLLGALFGRSRFASGFSSALRTSRPRFWSASDWLVVAASTPAETTLTGKVATSTAVLAMVPTTQPPRRRGQRATKAKNASAWLDLAEPAPSGSPVQSTRIASAASASASTSIASSAEPPGAALRGR